jgi:hypothetical protein
MENYTWPSGKHTKNKSNSKNEHMLRLFDSVGEKSVSEPLHSIQLDENTIHMQVKTGSKVANLTDYAFAKFEV